MFSYKEFARRAYEYLQHVEITSKNAKKIAEVLFYLAAELEENTINIKTVVDDLRVKRKSVFESKNFKNFFIKNVNREILKSHHEKDESVKTRIISRAYFSKNDVISQKKAMLQNKSKYSDLDLILAAIDISSDEEISKMYVTVRALKDKLDEETYSQLRKFARKKFKSCRIHAKYFLYVLSQIEEFEEEKVEEQKNVKTEKEKETKEKKKYNSKTEKKIDKSIKIHTSEADYKRYKKSEILDKETRYKLYLYRRKYEDELKNTKLTRLTKDDLLFFLINTERLIENQSLSLQQVLNIVLYADKNHEIENPIGWLIARFMIGRGRFYFLLNNKKLKFKQSGKMKSSYESSHEKGNDIEQEKESNVNDIYINSDLAYFMKKYNISSPEISSYLSKFEHLSGDVSYIVERYLINKIYKNYLSQEEKLKLIKYAKQEIRKFAVPPETEEEFKEEIKSIIAAKIKDDYLTLSIKQRLQLQMSGQYDTS
ncbi:hypothetical protein [Persephonella sp. KM09-Lau-8]|uniref:hypothetical protein n=1 Tax=Persephonella sp. KM09-Lau-8 TaxID=1158345 RepID=UPI000495370C|nr:hypothetical protein [Persephonella sp. KM09-Lau-8]